MSVAPQLSPAIGYSSQVLERDSLLTSTVHCATVIRCPTVLLVGRSGSWGVSMLRLFETFGAESFFAKPNTVTPEYVRERGYGIVLLDSTVSSEQRRRLASKLAGSHVSIFYTFPVENGCWWLPALRHGQDCHGAPAFRRNEFPFELARILQE